MEAQLWTLIGILVASQAAQLATYFYLRSRIDAFGARLDARIEAYEADLDAAIDRSHAG